jgi:hypothetical protein
MPTESSSIDTANSALDIVKLFDAAEMKKIQATAMGLIRDNPGKGSLGDPGALKTLLWASPLRAQVDEKISSSVKSGRFVPAAEKQGCNSDGLLLVVLILLVL